MRKLMALWKRLIIKVFYVSLKVAERKYQKKLKQKSTLESICKNRLVW